MISGAKDKCNRRIDVLADVRCCIRALFYKKREFINNVYVYFSFTNMVCFILF